MSFVPDCNVFSLAAHWAIYLSFYTLVFDKDVTVPFPGTENSYCVMFNDASADVIARSSIWASLYSERADNGRVSQCGR
jgi:hypothetical protein